MPTWIKELQRIEDQFAEVDEDTLRTWLWGCWKRAWSLIRLEIEVPPEYLVTIELLTEKGIPSPELKEDTEDLAANAYSDVLPGIPELLTALVLLANGEGMSIKRVGEISGYIGNAILDVRVLQKLEGPMSGADVDIIEEGDPICRSFNFYQLRTFAECKGVEPS